MTISRIFLRFHLLTFLISLHCITLAQTPLRNDSSFISIFDEMPNVHILQNNTISKLITDSMKARQMKKNFINGFRVQVFSSNQQQIAKNLASDLKDELSELIEEPVYIQYDSPFWKVRIGNFKTIQDANEYKNVLIRILPKIKQNTYVVRDIIQL